MLKHVQMNGKTTKDECEGRDRGVKGEVEGATGVKAEPSEDSQSIGKFIKTVNTDTTKLNQCSVNYSCKRLELKQHFVLITGITAVC